MNAQEFVQAYLEAEYALWVMAHTDRDDDRFFAVAEAFDKAYFGPAV